MLKLGYLGLSLLMTIILFLMGNYAIKKSVVNAKQKIQSRVLLLTGLFIWHLYLFIIGSSGLLMDLSFPPRFVLFMILPAFIFIGVFLSRNRKKQWIQAIPPHWLVAYQLFRVLIETLFVYTVAVGLLHKNVTIEGYNFDMVFAFTAPIVAIITYRSKKVPSVLLQIWNYTGLVVIASIIFLFNSTIYFPEIYGSHLEPFPSGFGMYPFVLVPGFLMPSAVFIHFLSLVQLKNTKSFTSDN